MTNLNEYVRYVTQGPLKVEQSEPLSWIDRPSVFAALCDPKPTMTLERAVKVLNDKHYRDRRGWALDIDGKEVAVWDGMKIEIKFTAFEAIAIAEALVRKEYVEI